MPGLVDTTVRLLSQEPLAERVPSARLYELASVLDEAGFGYLEVSGGGCFDSAVRRGLESPWERIRAIRARCKTPLGMALRGRFLVGTRPLSRDLVRRFISSAAASGIDVFRIHDPLNDVGNLSGAAGGARPPPAGASRPRPPRRGPCRADGHPPRVRLASPRLADRPGARLAGASPRSLC